MHDNLNNNDDDGPGTPGLVQVDDEHEADMNAANDFNDSMNDMVSGGNSSINKNLQLSQFSADDLLMNANGVVDTDHLVSPVIIDRTKQDEAEPSIIQKVAEEHARSHSPDRRH